jgi:hypothetical protein
MAQASKALPNNAADGIAAAPQCNGRAIAINGKDGRIITLHLVASASIIFI